MKPNGFNYALFATAIMALAVSLPLISSEEKQFTYVGSDGCKNDCHIRDQIGNQYAVWQRSPHSRAFYRLNGPAAKKIAEKAGVTNASDDKKCLKCHSTAGGRIKEIRDEGVGCEACHGPGSSYREFGNHVDYQDRKQAYVTARKNGMLNTLGDRNLKRREKLCFSCHNDKRPCYPTESKEIYRQTISLQVITEMRKGSLRERDRDTAVDLRHKLIPPFPND